MIMVTRWCKLTRGRLGCWTFDLEVTRMEVTGVRLIRKVTGLRYTLQLKLLGFVISKCNISIDIRANSSYYLSYRRWKLVKKSDISLAQVFKKKNSYSIYNNHQVLNVFSFNSFKLKFNIFFSLFVYTVNISSQN